MGEEHSGDSSVKYLIGRNAGKSAVIAGFIATHVATMAGYWFPGARLPQFPFNDLNGYLVLGLAFGAANPAINFVVGGIIHYTSGILWGVIFALIVHPMLGKAIKPLAPLNSTTNLVKGIIWGLALWVISSALWMPLLVGPLFDAYFRSLGYSCGVGPFLTCFGGYGVQALFSNLLWHTIYGVNLGLLFSPRVVSGWSKSEWRPSAGSAMR